MTHKRKVSLKDPFTDSEIPFFPGVRENRALPVIAGAGGKSVRGGGRKRHSRIAPATDAWSAFKALAGRARRSKSGLPV